MNRAVTARRPLRRLCEEAGDLACGVPGNAADTDESGRGRAGEGDRPVPRGHSEEITVNGQAEPVTVKLGVWVSNTKSRRNRLDADQLAELGMDWARPVTVPRAVPDGL